MNPAQDSQFRIAEIDVAKNTTDESIVGLFRFEAPTSGKQGPILLLIADIHSTLYVYERLLDVINATVEHARQLTAKVDQDPIGRFEKLVQRLNEAIASFSEAEGAPLNWKRINLYVIELSSGHLCLTGVGQLMNIFLQKQSDGSFRTFDLFGSLEESGNIDPHKPFSSLICGDIKPGDILMAGSSNLDRWRSDLQIAERLSSLPPITAALEIRQDLERRSIPDHFVAAVIACHPAAKPPSPATTTPQHSPIQSSTHSVEKLRTAEQETAERLSPVISPLAKGEAFKPIWEGFKKKLADAQNRLLHFRPHSHQPPNAMALASLRGMNAGYGSLFTPKRKRMILIGVAGLLIFLGLSGWWSYRKRIATELAAWNATFDQAADHRHSAESDLIYGNETQARQEILTAERLISNLPQTTPDKTAKLSQLAKDLQDLKERLKKINNVTTVTELTNLDATSGDNVLRAPLIEKSIAYAVDTATSAILKIDLASKNIKHVPLPSDFNGTVIAATENSTQVFFATQDAKLLSLKKDTGALTVTPWQHVKSSSTQDIVFYASKLYSLDPEHQQIWRFQNSGNGFGHETSYVKAANVSLENATAIAIDSSVYVAKNDGTVIRFLSGGQEGFNVAPIDPPLKSVSAIWTNADSQNVYLVDPTEKRIIVIDKNGNLKSQIVSPQFRALRDLSVDEANKQMLLIDGNRLLLVPLP